MDGREFSKTEEFLYALRNAGSKYSLNRISKFCAVLGNPQNAYPVIHVAGTNGKGSVCAMLERILRGSGMKTGMFTSPHLVYLGERIQINRQSISTAEIVSETARLRGVADSVFDPADFADYPSFFEYMTVLAFEKFKCERVDCAVVEVGLGGRLDSTNIVSPEISVISSIGFDHMQMLGYTMAAIAGEKAGIIKPRVPVVCGFLPDEAMRVMERVAAENNAPLYKAADFYPDDSALPETSLFGYYQKRNAAVATLAARVLKEKGGVFSKIRDVEKSLSDVSWAARWQTVPLSNGARLILDASHNEEGARTLESNLRELAKTQTKKPIIAIGVLGEERAVPLFNVVSRYARKIVLLVPKQPRALDFAALRRCIGVSNIEIEQREVSDVFRADNSCTLVSAGETVVCTGSIYLAGEVMAALGGKSADDLQDRPY